MDWLFGSQKPEFVRRPDRSGRLRPYDPRNHKFVHSYRDALPRRGLYDPIRDPYAEPRRRRYDHTRHRDHDHYRSRRHRGYTPKEKPKSMFEGFTFGWGAPKPKPKPRYYHTRRNYSPEYSPYSPEYTPPRPRRSVRPRPYARSRRHRPYYY
jgi:hypothetical protein